MKNTFNRNGPHYKLDQDLKYIHKILKDLWIEENAADAAKLTSDQTQSIMQFIQKHQSTAIKAMDAYENIHGEAQTHDECANMKVIITGAVKFAETHGQNTLKAPLHKR